MKLLLLLFLLLLVSACKKNETQLTKKQYFIFGTIVEVLIWHDNDINIQAATLEIETSLNSMHHQWHAWKPGKLNQINQALRNGRSVELDDEELNFISQTKELSLKSQGYFNPAIGELIHTWGFHSDTYPILKPPPNQSIIDDFVKNSPTMNDLVFFNNSISSNNSRIWLDYGGIAKGYAIDKAIVILQKHQIENAIVNAGGDLRSIGSKGKDNWKVAIRKPNSEDIIAIIDVNGDESVFTSGNYERFKEFDGKRYAHIINPFTGIGVLDVVSATVIADNGTKADAAATALIVAGIKNWKDVVHSMNLKQALIITEDGACFATETMVKRLSNTQLNCQLSNN